ncbi:MAG: cation diffusion facilitator family transporter [Acidimicrobiia bacterium]
MASGSKRLIVLALIANAAIAVTKFIAALISGSAAMFAEAIHSVADSGNQLFLLRGEAVSRYAPTVSHPYGRGMALYFWSFMVAIMLFVGGSAWSIFNGWQRIIHADDHHSDGLVFSLVVLAIAAVFEIFIAFRPAVKEFNALRGSRGVWRTIRRSKDPALIIVVFEDASAVAGLAIAATGLILAEVTANAVWDGVASVLIGVLLGIVAFVIAREMKALLEGEAASREDRTAIRVAILSVEPVNHVDRILTMHLGPHEILVNADVAFDDGIDEVEAIAAVKESVAAAVPAATRIFIEPTRR